MRGVFIIGFGVFLDFLQGMFALVFIALEFLTPAGGGVTGALAAGYYCWSTASGIFSGAYSAASCALAGGVVGVGVSAYAVPIGGAIDVVLTFTFGAALIGLLAFSGMFYPGIVIGSFIGETIPLFDAIFPGWTLMAWKCVHNKNKEEAAVRSKAAQQAAVGQIASSRQQTWEDIRVGNYLGNQAPEYAEVAA